jgi:hypothetical protein
MSTLPPPVPDDGDDAPASPRRGAHRAPTKPQGVLLYGLIAVGAVVALLVAFSSCGGGFDSGEGVLGGTPGVTTAPPGSSTTSPSGTATAGTSSPTATTAATPSRTPAPSTPATTAPATTRSPSPQPSPTTGPRITVDVLNGSTVTGLAQRTAAQVRAEGWTVGLVGNWRRAPVATTTVYYAEGDEGSARRLARELSGEQRVAPALSGMSTSRLTLVVRP